MFDLMRKNSNGNRLLGFPRLFDSVFEDFKLPDLWSEAGNGLGAIEVRADDKNYMIEVTAPGIEEKDLDVSLEKGILKISHASEDNKEEKDGERVVYSERCTRSFSRTLRLPEGLDTDGAEATLKNGVLTITLPKIEVPGAKKIEVKT